MEEYRKKQIDRLNYNDFIITIQNIKTKLNDYYENRIRIRHNKNGYHLEFDGIEIDKFELLVKMCESIKKISEQYIINIFDLIETILTISLSNFYYYLDNEIAYNKFIDFENELRKEYNYYDLLNPRFYAFIDNFLNNLINN